MSTSLLALKHAVAVNLLSSLKKTQIGLQSSFSFILLLFPLSLSPSHLSIELSPFRGTTQTGRDSSSSAAPDPVPRRAGPYFEPVRGQLFALVRRRGDRCDPPPRPPGSLPTLRPRWSLVNTPPSARRPPAIRPAARPPGRPAGSGEIESETQPVHG